MNYHGHDKFIIEVICVCHSEEDLNSKERLYIEQYNTIMPNGYNMTLGGDGGYTIKHWSAEDKLALYRKQALTRTGRTISEEQRINMSNAQKGKVISEDQKIKISATLKERWAKLPDTLKCTIIDQLTTVKCDRTGCTHTDEAKKVMSLSKKGKTYSEIYSEDYATTKIEQQRVAFLSNNPRAYDIPKETKDLAIFYIDSSLTAQEISDKLGVSLYKLRQVYADIGITNLQKHRGTEAWKIKNEH